MNLKELMIEYKLSNLDVAKMLGVQTSTVNMWRSIAKRDIPETKLELLRLKCAQRNAVNDGKTINKT